MTTQPERDENGRFVKPEPDAKPIPEGDIHPVSKLLFGWTQHSRIGLILLAVVAIICATLVVLDLGLHRHEYIDEANATGFYAIWGFGAFALAVLSGWPLGKLLRRDEDYYGEADITPDDIEERQ